MQYPTSRTYTFYNPSLLYDSHARPPSPCFLVYSFLGFICLFFLLAGVADTGSGYGLVGWWFLAIVFCYLNEHF
ncbi:hypothetical protein AG1IA_02158 [Rhizoctonia solani AG-1 IA]|uniref:Uncharacterized protein n=1 Tax=Thanatephorus cucumeris (strain AG1-IA) TaxID=983506 RepID=L8X0J1_THACA|nr:hypothetical protein AG1IA_02158 [Rhizoctonia solani AG-1 IA]